MNKFFFLICILFTSSLLFGQAQPPSWACRDIVQLSGEQFDSLQVLYLHEKELQDWPKEMQRARGLKRLWLTKMSYMDLAVILEQLQYQPQLEQLFLSENELSFLPASIANLQALRILYLDQNELDQLPEALGQLQNLEELHLGDNQLEQLPAWLEDLPNLRKLYLQGNPLSKESDKSRAIWKEIFKERKIHCQWNKQ